MHAPNLICMGYIYSNNYDYHARRACLWLQRQEAVFFAEESYYYCQYALIKQLLDRMY